MPFITIFSYLLEKCVHLSRLITIAVVMGVWLNAADSLMVRLQDRGSDNSDIIRQGIEQWRHRAIADGRLLATLHLKSIVRSDSEEGVAIVWDNSEGEPVLTDSAVLRGADDLSPRISAKLASPFVHLPATPLTASRAESLLNQVPFIAVADRPHYRRYGSDKIALVLPVESSFRNSFSGILGYRPGPEGNGRLTGDLSVVLGNLFNSAGTTRIMWKRKDGESQDMTLEETVPFLGDMNFGASAGVHQSLQDGLFLKRRVDLSVKSVPSIIGAISAGLSRTVTVPTDRGEARGIRSYNSRRLAFSHGRDTRDHPLFPARGFAVETRFESGKINSGESETGVLTHLSIRSEWIRPMSGLFSMALASQMGWVSVRGGSVPKGEKFRYGGAGTLRGYDEQLFRSDWMVIQQMEVRYQMDRSFRLFGFMDGALSPAPTPPFSGGIGLQQITALGMLTVEYAVNRDSRPSEGKIHLRFSGEIR